jgi:ribosomal protein S18 acetylase RimI-like enzyme
MKEVNSHSPLLNLCIRHVTENDLHSLEWDGEYIHYRRIFRDAFIAAQKGEAVLWIADTPQEGLIGQVFISLKSARQDLADGSNRAYLYGFRIRPVYRDLGIGTQIMYVVENDLVQRDFKILTLNVGRDNISALRFYKRMGFQIVHSDPGSWSYIDHHGRRHSVNEPAWRMEKVLFQD